MVDLIPEFKYKPDLVKIQANETVEYPNGGYKRLFESFWIIRLFENNKSIIGIIQNELNWDYTDFIMGTEHSFNYGDIIEYHKETKKITNYDHED